EAHRRGAVGGVIDEPTEARRARGVEAGLEARERLARDLDLGRVRRREVRAEPREAQRRELADAREGAWDVLRREAEPAHSGVYLDVNVGPAPAPIGRCREPLEIADVIDDRREP